MWRHYFKVTIIVKSPTEAENAQIKCISPTARERHWPGTITDRQRIYLIKYSDYFLSDIDRMSKEQAAKCGASIKTIQARDRREGLNNELLQIVNT